MRSNDSFLLQFGKGFSAAAMAESCTIPIDTVKVRKQLDPMEVKYGGMMHTVRTVMRSEGLLAFYNGLPAGIMRAGCIYAVRLGSFESCLKGLSQRLHVDSTSVGVKILAAVPVTFASMVVGNPFDVLKVRFQRAPTQEWSLDPRVVNSIIRTEGFIGGLYSGFMPNLTRNLIIGSAELVAYFQGKQYLIETRGWRPDDTFTHVMASAFAGLTAAVLGSPMDVVGTRVMQSEAVAEGISWPLYAARMLRTEGVQAFYRGFFPNWARLTSFNLVLWLTFEQIKKMEAER
mmetsp:Transcript_999/g.3269  ORF Transcript_999/g.3269 Transcript_999/m.3269 type:complete len:288 (-) Transcript_999:475-1338(-)